MSQSELAAASGVDRAAISAYEDGRREAPPATARRLAEALEEPVRMLRAMPYGQDEIRTAVRDFLLACGRRNEDGTVHTPVSEDLLRENLEDQDLLYVLHRYGPLDAEAAEGARA